MTEQLISAEQLLELCVKKFMKAGVSEDHARTAADVLVHANLRGVDSHGVMRMEHYMNKLAHGGINAAPTITFRETALATGIVDGDDGLGHVIVKQAMTHAIELARRAGVGMVSAINSSHCGALSYFVQMAADQGMIGMAISNTDKMVTPFGGSAAFFGTNPLAYGFPAGGNPPIILDMATSSVAYGKVLQAQQAGQTIPADWGVDASGQPVTDPHQVQALLPFGGAKGYGLGMMVDVFAGLLTGSPYGPHIAPMYGDDFSVRRKLGHSVIAIDIGRFTAPDSFKANMDQMVDELHAVPPAPGFSSVLLPGEPETRREAARREQGIHISQQLFDYLHQDAG